MDATDLRNGIATPYLYAWREWRLLSQAELARRAHVHRTTVLAGEHGQRIRLVSVGRLAKALGIDRQTLVYQAPPAQPELPAPGVLLPTTGKKQEHEGDS